MKITDKHVFFYKDWLSNYQKTQFYYPSADCPMWCFKTTEQGFMFFKALTFQDYETAEQIMNAGDNPGMCRKLGRSVKNYNDKIWNKIRYELFYNLNYQKYLQDKNLRAKLLDPIFDGKIFVEASPIDKIWGIGISEDNPNIENLVNEWGQNLLGKIITNIRSRFILIHN